MDILSVLLGPDALIEIGEPERPGHLGRILCFWAITCKVLYVQYVQ